MLSVQRNRELQEILKRFIAVLAADRLYLQATVGQSSPDIDGTISYINEYIAYLEGLIPSKVS